MSAAEDIKKAKVIRYEHGGGRMYYEDEKGARHLIADFYGNGDYREFILAALGRGERDGDSK
jgi:hypothetical protein